MTTIGIIGGGHVGSNRRLTPVVLSCHVVTAMTGGSPGVTCRPGHGPPIGAGGEANPRNRPPVLVTP